MLKQVELGNVAVTASVNAMVEENGLHDELMVLVRRHANADWGDVCDEDARLNDVALETDERLVSAYKLNGVDVMVITEWDRSVTTVLRKEEY